VGGGLVCGVVGLCGGGGVLWCGGCFGGVGGGGGGGGCWGWVGGYLRCQGSGVLWGGGGRGVWGWFLGVSASEQEKIGCLPDSKINSSQVRPYCPCLRGFRKSCEFPGNPSIWGVLKYKEGQRRERWKLS